MTGYAMRRARWMELNEQFPDMARQLKVHLVLEYDKNIRQPLLEHKRNSLKKLGNRADYTNVVAIQD